MSYIEDLEYSIWEYNRAKLNLEKSLQECEALPLETLASIEDIYNEIQSNIKEIQEKKA